MVAETISQAGLFYVVLTYNLQAFYGRMST